MRVERTVAHAIRLGLLLAACGPSPGEPGDESGSAGASGAEVSSSIAGPSSSEGPAPTTSADETSTSTTTSTTTSGGSASEGPGTTTTPTSTTGGPDETTGGLVCGEPDADTVDVAWTITMDGGPPPATVTAPCVVIASDVVGSTWTLVLDCALGMTPATFGLEISRTPDGGATLGVDAEVILEYRQEQPFWTNAWFALHRASNPWLVPVSGVQADHLVPDGTTAEEFFSVDLKLVEGLCEPVAGRPCGPIERLAVDAKWSSGQEEIFDGQFGALIDLGGHIDVWVGEATRPVDDAQCDDTPPAWFSIVMSGSFGP